MYETKITRSIEELNKSIIIMGHFETHHGLTKKETKSYLLNCLFEQFFCVCKFLQVAFSFSYNRKERKEKEIKGK